jgi:AbrB family looped-hinge helix DNA binding protein
MSSKGQVVIPDEIRRRLGLDAGTQFIVVGEDDVVILKMVRAPSMKDFDPLVRKARSQAKSAGLKRSDIASAVSEVRKRQ